jgi:hypothetical protein
MQCIFVIVKVWSEQMIEASIARMRDAVLVVFEIARQSWSYGHGSSGQVILFVLD